MQEKISTDSKRIRPRKQEKPVKHVGNTKFISIGNAHRKKNREFMAKVYNEYKQTNGPLFSEYEETARKKEDEAIDAAIAKINELYDWAERRQLAQYDWWWMDVQKLKLAQIEESEKLHFQDCLDALVESISE
jgi:hypothetical protein